MRRPWPAVLVALGLGPGRAARGQDALPVPEPAWAAEAPAAVEPAEQARISADEVVVQDGVVSGRGAVHAVLGEEELWAESFRLDLDSGLLQVEQGSWRRPAGEARFSSAQLRLRLGQEAGGGQGAVVEGTILDGSVRGEGVVLEGQRLRWRPDGALEGEGLRLTTCGCARPTWEVQARRAVVVPGDWLSFRGGLVRVLGLPVLPVPAGRLALGERVSGLLPPRVGAGQDGLVLAQPAWLALGPHADLALEPELRTARGARLLADGRWAHPGGEGQVRLVGGRDWQEDAWRGAGSLVEGLSSGPWRLGGDVRLEGDRDYLADYGDAFLSRSRPWGESLLVAGWGPVRLEHDGLQSLGTAGPQGQRPVGLVVERAGVRLGPLAVAGLARMDLVGEGSDPWQVDAGAEPRWEVGLGAEAGRDLGLVRLEARADARTLAYGEAAPWGGASATVAGWLPAWSELPGARLVGEWGLQAQAAVEEGTRFDRLPWDEAPPAWSLGPTVTGRLLTAAGVPLSGAAALPRTPEGWAPEAWLRADLAPWSLRAGTRLGAHEARVDYDDGGLALGAAAVAAEDLLQSRLQGSVGLPGALRGLRPGYAALLDVTGGRALAHGPRLAYDSPCGCLSLAASAAWAQDRTSPDLGLQLSLD